MNPKTHIVRLSGTIFISVAIIHLLRIITRVPVVINGWQLPLWVNIMGFIATAFLGVALWWVSVERKG